MTSKSNSVILGLSEQLSFEILKDKMMNNLAKELLPHAIILFVIEYAKRHEIKISDNKGETLLERLEVVCKYIHTESEA